MDKDGGMPPAVLDDHGRGNVDDDWAQEMEHGKVDGHSPIDHVELTFDTTLPRLLVPRGDGGPSELACWPRDHRLAAYMSPRHWSNTRKRVVLALSCMASFLTTYTAGAYSPSVAAMAHDMGSTQLAVNGGTATYCLGFALAPMVLAPVSEKWGRLPVLVAAGVLLVVGQAVSSAMTVVAGMLVMRFLVGCGASVFSALVGGVITDVWSKEDRNTPMALFSGCVAAGTGAGPLVASAIMASIGNATLAWKCVFWHQAVVDAAIVAALGLVLPETRASVLLARKARILNKWYAQLEDEGVYGVLLQCGPGTAFSSFSSCSAAHSEKPQPPPVVCLRRIRWQTRHDASDSLGSLVTQSMWRPFCLLLTEPIVFFFSLWISFAWAVLYLSFSVVSFVYPADFAASTRVYVALVGFAVLATGLAILQQRLLSHSQWQQQQPQQHQHQPDSLSAKTWALLRRHLPAEAPESRLYFTCLLSLLLPLGILIAFESKPTSTSTSTSTSPSSTPPPPPFLPSPSAQAMGLGLALCAIYSIYLAAFNYLADTYASYASSALAAQSFCRNIVAGAFCPLVAPMFAAMGLAAAGALLAALALALSPIPWVLVCCGTRIRARSRFVKRSQAVP